MKLKQFFGTNLQDAMKRARYELGDEILLIESQPIQLKGRHARLENLTQITVAIPDGASVPPTGKAEANPIPSSFQDYFRSLQRDAQNSAPGTEDKRPSNRINSKKQSQSDDRNLMQNTALPRVMIQLFDRLTAVGITPQDADYIIKQAFMRMGTPFDITESEAIAAIKSEVIRIIDVYSQLSQKKIFKQRIVALVGATGVGKTSVLMKLATHPEYFKKKKIALISTDRYRIAANETLQIFSQITNLPLFEAHDPGKMPKLLKQLQNYDTILLDTPGRSPFFPGFYHELQSWLKMLGEVSVEMVVSAAADLDDIFLNVSLWTLLEPAGLIVTKLDETSRPGKIVSLVRAMEVPIHFVSDGQTIPGDLHLTDGRTIWERIAQVW